MKGILQEILNETTIKVIPIGNDGESINVECDKYVVQSFQEEFNEEDPTIIVDYDENKKLITGDNNGIF